MPVRKFVTSESPEIIVEQADGDLVVRGWNENTVVIKSGGSAASTEQRDNQVTLRLEDGAQLNVPAASRLRIEHVDGDAVVTGLVGALQVGMVQGDLVVRDGGPLQVESVENNCTVRNARGDCSVQHVGNDATFAFIGGDLQAEDVGNDVTAHNVRGSIRVAAGDDVSLRLMLTPGHRYIARAGNDLDCRIQNDAGATVEVAAGNKLRTRRLNTSEPISGKEARFKLGAGDESTQLSLTAGDDLLLMGTSLDELGEVGAEIGMDFGLRTAELVQQFTTQFESQVGALAKQLDEKLTTMGNNEEIATRVQEKILAAARKAEEKIGEAMKKMERQGERRGGASWSATWNPGWQGQPPRPPAPPMPPQPPAPARAPASEEERLLVLKMVSEGKISVEQAEKLFAALNGRDAAPGDR